MPVDVIPRSHDTRYPPMTVNGITCGTPSRERYVCDLDLVYLCGETIMLVWFRTTMALAIVTCISSLVCNSSAIVALFDATYVS